MKSTAVKYSPWNAGVIPGFFAGLVTKFATWIKKYGAHPLAGPFLCFYAFIATVLETIPITFVLSLFVAMNRSRWKRLVFLSVLGSSIGSLVLAWFFHDWGYALIVRYYPNLTSSVEWKYVESWVAKFGMLAIALVAAIPFPLTPAIALCGLMRMPLTLLFVSVFLGKTVKYSVTAFAVIQSGDEIGRLVKRKEFRGKQHE